MAVIDGYIKNMNQLKENQDIRDMSVKAVTNYENPFDMTD